MSAAVPLTGARTRHARLMVLRIYLEPASATEPPLYWCYCPRCEDAHPGAQQDLRGAQDLVCSSCGEIFDIPTHAIIKQG